MWTENQIDALLIICQPEIMLTIFDWKIWFVMYESKKYKKNAHVHKITMHPKKFTNLNKSEVNWVKIDKEGSLTVF